MTLWPYSDMPGGEKENEAAMRIFMGANELAHNGVYGYLISQGFQPPHYPLGEMGDQDDWLDNHQHEHEAWCELLNLNPPSDMSDWELDDPKQRYDWMQIHAAEHDRIIQAIGF